LVIAHRDRYGYPAQAHGRLRCGLVFLNPRMTAGPMAASTTVSARSSAHFGRLIDAHTIQAEQRNSARARRVHARFCTPRASRRCSTSADRRVVASHFAAEFGLRLGD
jgi:hypothetical protein